MTDTVKTEDEVVSATDVLGMSDADMLNLNSPSDLSTEASTDASVSTTDDPPSPEPTGEDAVGADAAADAAAAPAGAADGEAADATKAADAADDKAAATTDADKADKADKAADATDSATDKAADGADKPTGEAETVEAPVNFEDAYKKIMAPFKANGKTIELRDPDEAIKLMQMGANYTRKLQELQPHRKIVTMLGNNGLLDEGKLSFLIDLEKGDPEAIKKLIKDKGIDVLDIDTQVDPAYVPGSHQVSDAEINFRAATEELVSTPTGRETIAEIHDRWDETSKSALWEKPEMLAVIHENRESGAYARIVEEMDRQITLGNIPANTPFLEAYVQVGDQMVAAIQAQMKQQAGDAGAAGAELAGTSPQPIASRAAPPKPTVIADDAVKAAATTRASPKKAEVFKNPLAQSDDDFLKSMEGRV